jgi:hypothetical protein
MKLGIILNKPFFINFFSYFLKKEIMENSQNLDNQDYLNASLLFSQALALVLDDKQGIVVDVKNDEIKLNDEASKVVIYKLDSRIHIQKLDMDIQEGTIVSLSNKDEEEENN